MSRFLIPALAILLQTIFLSICGDGAAAAEEADPLAAWRTARVGLVSPEEARHSIHSYFNTCPESPDGKFVLFYTSTTADGHHGEIRIRDRQTGEEKLLARNLHVEDAHRAACQQWVSQGRRVVFHAERGGRWFVAAVDVATGQERILAQDQLAGWGQPHADLVPLYGLHWSAEGHRNLDLVNVASGEIKTALTLDAVRAEYSDWFTKSFGDRPVKIFFPVLGPDLQRVFFKMAAPAGGDARSKQASVRQGLLCYSLADQRFLYMNSRWGHPSWHSDGRTIVEMNNQLFDSNTGQSRRIPQLPKWRGDHPSLSPDGKLLVTDTKLDVIGGNEGDWGIIVADVQGTNYVVLHRFNNSRGASSWRPSHPHPVFSPDGRRVYFNVSDGPWTRLHVAEIP